MAIGSGKLIVTQRQGNGSYRTYLGLQVPESFFRDTVDLQDLETTRRLLLSEFYADWAEDYKDVIRHGTDLRAWPLYSLPAEGLPWPSIPGFTLAGDAAHLALPNGEGVNLAMTDSLKLASKIAELGIENIDHAVREFEEGMFKRGIASITDGYGLGKVMFGEGPQQLLDFFASSVPAE